MNQKKIKESVENLLNTIEGSIIEEDLYLLENNSYVECIRDYLKERCSIHLRNYTGENKQKYLERFSKVE